MLKENEYQREDLPTETSSKAKKSKCFETNTLCVFTSTKNEGKGQNMNSILGENGTTESHVHAYAQLNKSNRFQLTIEAESKKDLAHNGSQELKELRKDSNHTRVMHEIDEKETIEDFLCLITNFGQQKEDLMIESSNKTIGSCEFEADRLNVFTGCIEDNPYFGVVSSKAEVCLVRHNDRKNVKYEDIALEEVD